MRNKGFTLIELVMVMAIICVVAAIVLPRLDPFVPQRRLKSAARLLSGTITLAYGESISRNKVYRLYLEPESDKYWITEVRKLEESEDAGNSVGIRLGTHFELLQYEEIGGDTEENAPTDPMLAPRKLPPGVHFASLRAGDGMATASPGPQYIEFNPLGSATPATIQLMNDEGESLVVRYDGVTGMPTLVSENS